MLLNSPTSKYRGNYEFGHQNPIAPKKPIHECITIAALILSNKQFPEGATYKSLDKEDWEFMRGAVWNDDPSCLLFEDSQDNNHKFRLGAEFLDGLFGNDNNCLTRRSHFGNMQFLHSMATQNEQEPDVTKKSLLAWIEVMYKLACGNQGVSENDKLSERFPLSFSSTTKPTGDATIKDLILGKTARFMMLDIQSRALGVCLHTIQDSYAVGHTLRRLIQPQHIVGKSPNGMYADYLDVHIF